MREEQEAPDPEERREAGEDPGAQRPAPERVPGRQDARREQDRERRGRRDGAGVVHARRSSVPVSERNTDSSEPSLRDELGELACVHAELGERALRDQLPVVEDADAVAELLGDREAVGREEDRDAARGEPAEELAERERALRVHADHRLVEDEDARPVDERGGERQALLHPVRVGLDQLFRALDAARTLRAGRCSGRRCRRGSTR